MSRVIPLRRYVLKQSDRVLASGSLQDCVQALKDRNGNRSPTIQELEAQGLRIEPASITAKSK